MNGRTKAVVIALILIVGLFAFLLVRFEKIDSEPPEEEEEIIQDAPAETEKRVRQGGVLPTPSNETPEFRFLTEPGVYTRSVTVEIASPEGSEVYYTTDGNLPKDCVGEKNCKKYDGGVKLSCTLGTIEYNCFTVQYVKDGEWSEPIYNTYVSGAKADERFTTLSVFITCEPDKLFGYESGILVAGKLRDDWIKEHPGEKPISISPAGFMQRGRDSEREVNVQMFTADGQSVINQLAGVRPYGAYTRAYKFKSIKLYARKEYDETNNKFRYDVFDGLESLDGEGRNVMAFKKLLLRSSGSDARHGMMRDELHQELCLQAGFPGATAVTPVAVYINGSYYGQMWIHDVIDDEYFEQNYGYYDGTMAVVSGPERNKPDKRYAIDDFEEEEAFYNDWNTMYWKYAKLDLTDDSNYEALCKEVDVENYLFYYAINTYVNNSDWPYNNHKAYRYYAAEGEEYREGTVFDGRWRFLPHDMDGFWEHTADILNNYLLDPKQSRYSPLFGALLKREDCRDYYVRSLMELMNGAFSADNYTATIEKMNAERAEEVEFFLKTGEYAMVDLSTWKSYIERFVNYAQKRPDSLIDDLKRAFGFSGATYKVHVRNFSDGYVKMGNWTIEGSYTANVIIESSMTFTAYPLYGYEFDHWEVNGNAVYSQSITLDNSERKGQGFSITPVFRAKEEKRLTVSEYSSKDGNDYIVIYNPYGEAVSAKGYSVSDAFNKLGKYVLPDISVDPKSTVVIYCSNYTGDEKLHNMCCPFSLKKGETLYFSYEGSIIERIDVADLHSGYKAVRDMKTGVFIETKK